MRCVSAERGIATVLLLLLLLACSANGQEGGTTQLVLSVLPAGQQSPGAAVFAVDLYEVCPIPLAPPHARTRAAARPARA